MKKKFRLTPALVTLGLFVAVSTAQADQGYFSWVTTLKRQIEVAPVTDAVYKEECGSCHFAYQPGWLPKASWQKLLEAKALEDHFGDNAELGDKTRRHLLDVLVANAADTSRYKRSRKVMASLRGGEAPLRITEVPYIRDKHREIPQNLIKQNDKVRSLSFCNRCHRKADEAVFDDDTVDIPGHGRWDD